MISIVIAAKNPPSLLMQRCISSFAALESSDCLEVCIVLSGTIDPQWRKAQDSFKSYCVVEVEPLGVYSAYNHGVGLVSGEYVLFFGIDDIALPEMDGAISYLLKNKVDLLVGDCISQLHGVLSSSEFMPLILLKNWCHQGIFYNKNIFDSFSYDLRYKIQADHFLNIQIASDPSKDIVSWRKPISYFSSGGLSSLSNDFIFRDDLVKISSFHFGFFWGLLVFVKQKIGSIRRKITTK